MNKKVFVLFALAFSINQGFAAEIKPEFNIETEHFTISSNHNDRYRYDNDRRRHHRYNNYHRNDNRIQKKGNNCSRKIYRNGSVYTQPVPCSNVGLRKDQIRGQYKDNSRPPRKYHRPNRGDNYHRR